MRFFYNILFYSCIPFILLRLWWRGRKAPSYRERWAERFAFFDTPNEFKTSIWIHAVSVGEVIAAIPLIKRIKQHYPEQLIVVTTMTPTGSARVIDALESQVFHVYVPYDLPDVVDRFMNKLNPKLVVIMETELWPNMLHQCGKRHIPVILANARLSPRSAKSYQYIAPLMKALLNNINILAAQGQADADRFIASGMAKERVHVTGSIKFDIQFPASVYEKSAIQRQLWGSSRPIWIAASTHEGEEEIILDAFKEVVKVLPNVLLVLVPRHPERFAKVENMCVKAGFVTARRSVPNTWQGDTQVYIGDTMGELPLLYGASDVAFVGGSLVQVGGHNLLEPAALSIPAITGPYMHNFVEINHLLQKAGAVKEVLSHWQLAEQVLDWLQHNDKRIAAGEQGLAVVEQNRGALSAHLKLIDSLVKEYPIDEHQ